MSGALPTSPYHPDMRDPDTARPALMAAFFDLIMAHRYSQISVQKVCTQAHVARSTFYKHFKNLDDLLLANIAPQIGGFARGLLFEADRPHVLTMVEHFWEQRRLSELWRDARFRDMFENQLCDAFAQNRPDAITNRYQAAGITATLRHWINGRLTAKPEDLAQVLITLIVSPQIRHSPPNSRRHPQTQ